MAPLAEQPRIVIDGVRHIVIHRLLRMRAVDRRTVLVYIETPSAIRRMRLAEDGTDIATIDTIMAHSTESELPLIHESADLIVDGFCEAKNALIALEAILDSPQFSEE
jgi:hypothetical protein